MLYWSKPLWKWHPIGRFGLLMMLTIGSIIGGGSSVRAETNYIPQVNFAQRYDSNVFYTSKEFVPAGKQQWDLISTLTTGLKLLNKSRAGDTELTAGVSGNVYAYNTYLSYASVYANGSTDISDWVHEFLPGLKLVLSDLFYYTPEPSAFLPGGKAGQSDAFARGIQTSRANTFANNLTAKSDYSFSRSWGLRTDYAYSIRRVGQIFAAPTETSSGISFFNTTVNRVTTGPRYVFDNGDSLFLKYSYLTADSVPETSGKSEIKFSSNTLEQEYVSKLIRDWIVTVSGGGTVVEQAGNRAFFSGRLVLLNNFDRRTRVSISVSRQATPAFFGTGGAMISDVAQAYLSHNLSRLLTFTVSGNYAHNTTTTTTPSFTFETISGNAALDYKLTRSTKVSLLQEYAHYNYTGIPNFDRYATTLMLSTEWQ